MLQENHGTNGSANLKDRQVLDHTGTLVSVIIPSRNSEHTIADCLRSVFLQSYRPIEVIVVDCFSTDSTKQIAQKMGALVLSHGGGRSAQKNFGAKFANGEYLYFVDADYKLDPNVISTSVKAMDRADGVLIRNQDVTRRSKVSQLIASRRKVLSMALTEVEITLGSSL